MSYQYQEEPYSRRQAALPGAERTTLVTWALLAINIVVWVAMELAGSSENPGILLTFGAMHGPLIASGEYWRLFTAMFLHSGLQHLLSNGLALLVFGFLLERIYGWPKFTIIYILAGLSGSVASYTFNDLVIGVGASGAILGLMGAIVAFFIVRREELGHIGRQTLVGLVIITVVMLAIGFSVAFVENWAHIGGLVGGFVLGLAFAPRYQARFLTEPMGLSYRLVDVSSAIRRWWVVPVALAVLAGGVWLATSSASDAAQAQTHVIRAERLLDEQSYDEALREAERAVELDPNSGPALFIRGKVYAELGLDSRAISDLGTSLSFGLDPDSQQEAISLLVELQRRGRF